MDPSSSPNHSDGLKSPHGLSRRDPAPPVPPVIGRYEIVRAIGEGGMGRVFLATDKVIGRPVALKLISLAWLPEAGISRDDVIPAYLHEIQTAGALLHPNIVVIFDAGIQDDYFYMVMEFVFGKTLLRLQRSNTFSINKALETVYELALAVEYAHSRSVVHRDIKPENIIVSTQGVPKITDFGIARFKRQLRSGREVLIGSSRFMAPEQVLRHEQDHRVDIYQLGVLLYELLTGKNPFRDDSPEITLSRIRDLVPPPPSLFNPQVEEDIDWIVGKCLEKSPQLRFSSARELADYLAQSMRSGIVGGEPPARDLVQRLRQFEIFSMLSGPEIEELARIGDLVSFSRGEAIIRENESDSNFYVLLDGRVQVQKKSRILTRFLPGACFGEIGAFARQRRAATVVAYEPSKLFRINALLFGQCSPHVQLKVLRMVVRHLANLVISLDDEIVRLAPLDTQAEDREDVCQVCRYHSDSPIEICPQCGVVPSRYFSDRSELSPTESAASDESSTGRGSDIV
ncbi:MAG: serine/threonine-protein kinase [Thermodesulfobacteriota bacterium]